MNYFTKRLMSVTLAALMAGTAIPAAALATDVTVNDAVEAQAVEDSATPVANTGLAYTGKPQALVTGGTSLYYYVSTSKLTSVNAETYTKTAVNANGTDAGDYYVYYGNLGEKVDISKNVVKVTIAKALPTVDIDNRDVVASDETTKAYNILKDNDTFNKFELKLQNDEEVATVFNINGTKFTYGYYDADGEFKGNVTYEIGGSSNNGTKKYGTYKLKKIDFAEKSSGTAKNYEIVYNFEAGKQPVLTIKKPAAIADTYNLKLVGAELTKTERDAKNNNDTLVDLAGVPNAKLGDVVFTYKNKATGATTNYAPKAIGEYEVTATLNDNGKVYTSNTVTLKIVDDDKVADAAPTITKLEIYGDTYYDSSKSGNEYTAVSAVPYTGKPIVVNATAKAGDEDYTGTVYYEYKKSSDSNWSNGLPVDQGSYIINAYVLNNKNVRQEIVKNTSTTVTIGKASLTVKDFSKGSNAADYATYYYNGKPITGYKAAINATSEAKKKPYETDISDQFEFSYVKDGSTTVIEGLPKEVGKYTITVKLPTKAVKDLGTSNIDTLANTSSILGSSNNATITESGKYYTFTNKVEIATGAAAKFDSDPTVKNENGDSVSESGSKYTLKYTGKPVDFTWSAKVSKSGSDEYSINDAVKYQYQDDNVKNAPWVSGLPTEIGTYNVKAIVEGTDGYDGAVSNTKVIKIEQGETTIKLPAAKNYAYTGSAISYTAKSTKTADIKYQNRKLGVETWTDGLPTNVGTYEVKSYIATTDKVKGEAVIDKIIINKAANEITLDDQTVEATGSAVSATATAKFGTPVLTYKAEGATEFTSTAPSAVGTYTVKAEVPVTENYTAASKTATLTIKEAASVALKSVTVDPDTFVYVYKTDVAPAITVTDANDKTVDPANYTVTVDNKRLVGKHTVTVTGDGKKYTGTVTADFTIKPQATTITSVKAGKKSATVKFAKVKNQLNGYEVQYARNSKFTNATTKKVSKLSTSKSLTKLTSGKKYYVRVRTYKTVDGTKFNSAWSAAKTVTVK